MLNELGEDKVKAILSDFICPLNKDVEGFLRNKAIEFAKQGLSATHLIFANYGGSTVLIGYFTLATKIATISRRCIRSNSMRKRINKFAQYDQSLKRYSLPMPLIAQLGKNFNNEYDKLITGEELIQFACDKVKQIQLDSGGRYVYLECEDKPQLTDFYDKHGFVNFGKRSLEGDEFELFQGRYLVQMLKYLSR
ncbi:MAG: N-acetyltransferase [Firmicutes bacterium]|nr:N-acetyltransferase [Bacillota bacterium]